MLSFVSVYLSVDPFWHMWCRGGHRGEILLIFGRFWEPLARLGGTIGGLMGAWNATSSSLAWLLDGLWSSFYVNLAKIVRFVILTPLCSGITTFEGPAAQVGAARSTKSRPRWARSGLNRGRDDKKGAKSGRSCRSVCQRSGTVRKSTKIKRNSDRVRGQDYLSSRGYD